MNTRAEAKAKRLRVAAVQMKFASSIAENLAKVASSCPVESRLLRGLDTAPFESEAQGCPESPVAP